MKRLFILIIFLACLPACKNEEREDIQRMLENYADIQIGPSSTEAVSDIGREVLRYLKLAADEADNIYWEQNFYGKKNLGKLKSQAEADFADLNYGPWDKVVGNAFIQGWGKRPLGANFYPSDMTRDEFDAWNSTLKNSPYTLIRRDSHGSLKAIWYHEAYAEHVEKIAGYLRAAASQAIKPSFREYLLAKAADLQTDDYSSSDVLWLSMTDSKMDFIIGPEENEDDRLMGIKTSYEAYILLKNLELTAKANSLTPLIPELQASLPCDDAYKAFTPGENSTIYVYDAIYCSGVANSGVKKIAINLPYDLEVQKNVGTRTAILNNILDAKYSWILLPSGTLLLAGDQPKYMDRKSFFWYVAMREVAHGIGVKETVNGKGTVSDALGEYSLTIEELLGDSLGLYMELQLIRKGYLDNLITRETAITTYLVGLIRSSRFGEANALGSANLIVYNFLRENNAFIVDHNGRYHLDYDNAERAITALATKSLTIQATGDLDAAKALAEKYGTTPESLILTFDALQRAHIPMDVRFEYLW